VFTCCHLPSNVGNIDRTPVAGYSPCSTMGRTMPPKLPFPWGIRAPTQHVVPWFHPSPSPKRYHERFIRFLYGSQLYPRQTDKQTDHATTVARGRIFARRACDAPMQLRNISRKKSPRAQNKSKQLTVTAPQESRVCAVSHEAARESKSLRRGKRLVLRRD